MASTFTLTGTLTHQDGVTPVANSGINVKAAPYPDPTLKVLYTRGVNFATDANGAFSKSLITATGLYYTIRSTARTPLFQPIVFAAPSAGSTVDLSSLTFYNPTTPPSETLIAGYAAAAAASAASAAAAGAAWQASTSYATGVVVQAPDGSRIKRIASGTSRATFDSTEQALWTPVSTTAGTIEKAALDTAYRYGNRRLVTIATLPTTGLHSAHRSGGGGYPTFAPQLAPDNALSAVRTSTALGYQIIDADYQLTQDGVPVMMHDTTVDRTTNGTGLVSSYPFALLPQIDMRYACGNGWGTEAVATLEELIAQYGGRVILTIEAKGGAPAVPMLSSIIKGYGLEQSIFVNCNIIDTGCMDAVVAAGLLLHVYGATTTGDVTTANTHGAWLLEVPYNASSAIVSAATGASNIKRVIAAPISKRVERDAITSGIQGYVANSIGYLDQTPDRRDIIAEIAQQKAAPGWYSTTEWARGTFPLFAASNNVSLSVEGGSRRDLLLGAMCSPKPATYSVDQSIVFGPWTADTNCRYLGRIACPSDEGASLDTDSRGYPYAIRKSGQMILWNAPVGYGAATALATIQTPAVSDSGGTVRAQLDVTATTVALTRMDAPITLSGSVTAGTVTSLPVTALTTAVASGTPLKLANGQFCAASALANIGATAITVTSFTLNQTLPSAAPVYYSTGAIANTSWRGDYMWIGGSLSGSQNRGMELTSYFWGVPQAYLSAAVSAGTVTSLTVFPLAASIASGTVLRLPGGTIITTSATAATNATSISVTSVAVPAMKAGDLLYLN